MPLGERPPKLYSHITLRQRRASGKVKIRIARTLDGFPARPQTANTYHQRRIPHARAGSMRRCGEAARGRPGAISLKAAGEEAWRPPSQTGSLSANFADRPRRLLWR